MPAEFVGFLTYLLGKVLGHNANVTERPARTGPRAPGLRRLRRDTAATGVWDAHAVDRVGRS